MTRHWREDVGNAGAAPAASAALAVSDQLLHHFAARQFVYQWANCGCGHVGVGH